MVIDGIISIFKIIKKVEIWEKNKKRYLRESRFKKE